MSKVIVADHGGLEAALKHFRHQLMSEGVLRELKRHTYHVPRSEARKQKSLRARRRRGAGRR